VDFIERTDESETNSRYVRAQKQIPCLILICYYITKVFYENMNYVFYTKSIII